MKKILLAFITYFVFLNPLNALIEVDITRGNLDPLPIAVSPLHVDIKSVEHEGIKVKELGNYGITFLQILKKILKIQVYLTL